MSNVRSLSQMSDANFPKDNEGRVYHLAVKHGEVANRILSVGDPQRAAIIASLLDNPANVFEVKAKRGFVIYTGRKNNVPVSIIATGMGFPMMDFVVRETRAIVDGHMAIIRLGTCGTPRSDVDVGCVSVASPGSVNILRNPDAFDPSNTDGKIPYYTVSKLVQSDKDLTETLVSTLQQSVKSGQVIQGLNATADTFYSTQGRQTALFDDHNKSTIEDLDATHHVTTLEMETFHLLHLAKCSFGSIKAAASTIVLAQRKSNAFLDHSTLVKLEKEAGEGCLQALASYSLESTMDNDPEAVWNKVQNK